LRKPGPVRIASSGTAGRSDGRAAVTGTRPAFVWSLPGTLPRSRSVGRTRACPAAGRTPGPGSGRRPGGGATVGQQV